MIAPKNARMIKQSNCIALFGQIRRYGPLTMEDLIRQSRLSRPTAVNLVKELTEAGLVHKTGFATSSGGRIPALLDINPAARVAVGVDLEIPAIRVGLVDLKGQALATEAWTVEGAPNDPRAAEREMDRIVGRVRALLDAHGVSGDGACRLLGLGVGMSSLIDARRGVSIHTIRMAAWESVPVAERLAAAFGAPVRLENDVHMLAAYERHVNPAASTDDFAYVGIRPSGVGGALFLGGRPHAGHWGNAGFFGHMTIAMDGEPCACGRRGCLEAYVSPRAMRARLARRMEARGRPRPDTVDPAEFDAAVRGGDPDATAVLAEGLDALGVGVANVVKALDVPLVIVSGLPETARARFDERVVGTARHYGIRPARDDDGGGVDVRWGMASNDDGVLGAAYHVLDRFFKQVPVPGAVDADG